MRHAGVCHHAAEAGRELAVMTPKKNLRGWSASVDFDGVDRVVTVVTHVRNDIWLIDGRTLPKRFERYHGCRRTTVPRDWLTLIAPPRGRVRMRAWVDAQIVSVPQ